jgi:hypothetical protein
LKGHAQRDGMLPLSTESSWPKGSRFPAPNPHPLFTIHELNETTQSAQNELHDSKLLCRKYCQAVINYTGLEWWL